MSIEEVKYAVAIGKPVVAVRITEYSSNEIVKLNIDIISYRKDCLENWIDDNV